MLKSIWLPHFWRQKLHDFHIHLTRIHAVHLVDLVPEFLGADSGHGFEDIHTCGGFEPKTSGGFLILYNTFRRLDACGKELDEFGAVGAERVEGR